MNTRTMLGLAAATTAAFGIAAPASAQKVVDFPGHTPMVTKIGQQGGSLIENQFVCAFARGAVSRANVRAAANRAANAHGGQVFITYNNTFQGFAVRMSPQGIAQMQSRNPDIAYCEQDRAVALAPPSDRGPKDKGGGGGSEPTEEVPPGIAFVLDDAAPAAYTGGGRAFVVDTGVDLTHPDLNVSQNFALHKSYITSGNDTSANDQNGHGTHVAGTIAARLGNNIGVVGVAPGAEVVSIRVLDRNGRGSCSTITDAIDELDGVVTPDDVVNMSLGCPTFTSLDTAVTTLAGKGIRFAIAAGNDGRDADDSSPARTGDAANVYTIAALDTSYTKLTSWSNYGAAVDYAEPGASIKSTWKNGGYNTISGTSMAAPHMAGLLLLGAIKSGGNATGTGGPYVIGIN